MAELIAKSALAGRGPLLRAETTLSEGEVAGMVAVMPYPGKLAAVDAVLAPLGVAFPGPKRQSVAGAVRLVWTGREQAFLIGAAAPAGLAGIAAVTDQSDGWAVLRLAGPLAVDVLACLVPLDLRPAAFAEGAVMRTGLNHMACILTRTGPAAFEIMVFRSMARTAWAELAEALERQAARLNALA